MRAVIRLFALIVPGTFIIAPSQAAVIVIGDRSLLPDKPGQTLQIEVSGGDAVQGLNFYAQIADGGPAAGGVVNAPTITSVDVITNTIFALNNTGQQNPGSLAQVAARTTTTSNGTVDASGLLATLTINTTGYTTGTWSLNLEDTLNGPTDFAGTPIDITDGTLTIADIPEPTIFPAIGSLLILARKRR